MDITFKTPDGIFNYRVCAVILHEGKLLAMKNGSTSYFYLPGGRVQLHESAQHAVLREVREELGVNAKIIRPLWLNQGFFTEDVTHDTFHELCVYFLMDISETDLFSRGNSFTAQEGATIHSFFWLPVDSLKDEYLYPLFIKDKIHDLPQTFTILTEYE